MGACLTYWSARPTPSLPPSLRLIAASIRHSRRIALLQGTCGFSPAVTRFVNIVPRPPDAPDFSAQADLSDDERETARATIARGETARVCLSVPGQRPRVVLLESLEDVERIWPGRKGRRAS